MQFQCFAFSSFNTRFPEITYGEKTKAPKICNTSKGCNTISWHAPEGDLYQTLKNERFSQNSV